jgi:cytochrome c biogenesis protein
VLPIKERKPDLSKGEVVQVSEILGQHRTFSLKLDDFRIDTYPDGTPSQYTSCLTLLEPSINAGTFDVTVNHPLVYQGVKIYQESYGWAVTAVSGAQSQMNSPATVKEGDFLSIPGAQFKIRLYRFIPDYDEASGMESRSPQPLNPRIIYSVYEGDQLLDVGLAKLGQRLSRVDQCIVKMGDPEN